MKRALVYLLFTLLLFLAGCGGGINAFKELGVSNKDVPAYEISSNIGNQTPPTQLWIAVNAENIDENQAKQIIADVIDKKLKENNNSVKGIMVIVKVKKEQYTAHYVKDEETLKTISLKTEAPKKYPAIIYSKVK